MTTVRTSTLAVALLLLLAAAALQSMAQLNFPSCLSGGTTCSLHLNEDLTFSLQPGEIAYVYADLLVDGYPNLKVHFSAPNLPANAAMPYLIWRPFVMPAVEMFAGGQFYSTCGSAWSAQAGGDYQQVDDPPPGRYYFVFMNPNSVAISGLSFELESFKCANGGFGSICFTDTVNAGALNTEAVFGNYSTADMQEVNPSSVYKIPTGDYFEKLTLTVTVQPSYLGNFSTGFLPVVYMSYGNLGMDGFAPLGQNMWTTDIRTSCLNAAQYQYHLTEGTYTCTRELPTPKLTGTSIGFWYVALYGPSNKPDGDVIYDITFMVSPTQWTAGNEVSLANIIGGGGLSIDRGTSDMYYFDVTDNSDVTYSFQVCPNSAGEDTSSVDIGVAYNALADVGGLIPIGRSDAAAPRDGPAADGDCHALSGLEGNNPHWWLSSPYKGRYYFQVFLPLVNADQDSPWTIHFGTGRIVCQLPSPGGDGDNSAEDEGLDVLAMVIAILMFSSFACYVFMIIAVAVAAAIYYPQIVVLYRQKFSNYEVVGRPAHHDEL